MACIHCIGVIERFLLPQELASYIPLLTFLLLSEQKLSCLSTDICAAFSCYHYAFFIFVHLLFTVIEMINQYNLGETYVLKMKRKNLPANICLEACHVAFVCFIWEPL